MTFCAVVGCSSQIYMFGTMIINTRILCKPLPTTHLTSPSFPRFIRPIGLNFIIARSIAQKKFCVVLGESRFRDDNLYPRTGSGSNSRGLA